MEGYRFTMPYRVRVVDVNYGAHVANSAVLNFFQDARIAYLADLGPFTELDIGEGRGIILPEAQVRYLAEMFLNDELLIGVRVSEIRNSAFVMEYRIQRDDQVTAEGVTQLVAFDYGKRKACRLPKMFRQALCTFEPNLEP